MKVERGKIIPKIITSVDLSAKVMEGDRPGLPVKLT